jgi:hypothetical protein
LPDQLLDGVEKMLTGLIEEAMTSEHEVADQITGRLKRVSNVSFEERLKLVATCTKFLEAKKALAPPVEKPSDFQEMLNGNGTAVSAENAGAETRKRRGRPPRNRLPDAQFDPDNGRTGADGGEAIRTNNGFPILNGDGSTGAAAAAPFWGDDNDAGADA